MPFIDNPKLFLTLVMVGCPLCMNIAQLMIQVISFQAHRLAYATSTVLTHELCEQDQFLKSHDLEVATPGLGISAKDGVEVATGVAKDMASAGTAVAGSAVVAGSAAASAAGAAGVAVAGTAGNAAAVVTSTGPLSALKIKLFGSTFGGLVEMPEAPEPVKFVNPTQEAHDPTAAGADYSDDSSKSVFREMGKSVDDGNAGYQAWVSDDSEQSPREPYDPTSLDVERGTEPKRAANQGPQRLSNMKLSNVGREMKRSFDDLVGGDGNANSDLTTSLDATLNEELATTFFPEDGRNVMTSSQDSTASFESLQEELEDKRASRRAANGTSRNGKGTSFDSL